MDKNLLFTFVILTYNRPTLLSILLDSLRKQIKQNFEVLIVDNGSTEKHSVDKRDYIYPIKLITLDENYFGGHALNSALPFANGRYIFPFVADDDFFHPECTLILSRILEHVPSIEVMSIGYARVNLGSSALTMFPQDSKKYSGQLTNYSAIDTALASCSSWGIGPLLKAPMKVHGHPSGSLFSKDCITRTMLKQGSFFCGPFPDCGSIGGLLVVDRCFHLDLPLVLLSEGHVQATANFGPKGRWYWNFAKGMFLISPLKGVSHFNCALESHLQVLVRHGFEIDISRDLRIDFYLNHLNMIATDDPVSAETIEDLKEGISQLRSSFQSHRNISQILVHYERILRSACGNLENTAHYSKEFEGEEAQLFLNASPRNLDLSTLINDSLLTLTSAIRAAIPIKLDPIVRRIGLAPQVLRGFNASI